MAISRKQGTSPQFQITLGREPGNMTVSQTFTDHCPGNIQNTVQTTVLLRCALLYDLKSRRKDTRLHTETRQPSDTRRDTANDSLPWVTRRGSALGGARSGTRVVSAAQRRAAHGNRTRPNKAVKNVVDPRGRAGTWARSNAMQVEEEEESIKNATHTEPESDVRRAAQGEQRPRPINSRALAH